MADYCDSPDSDRFNAGFASFCKLSDYVSAAFMLNAVNCPLYCCGKETGLEQHTCQRMRHCSSAPPRLLILMSVADEPFGMNLHGHPRCSSMTPNAHITVWGNGFQINIMAVNKEAHLCILFCFSALAICAASFGSDMTTDWWGVCLLKIYFCLDV